MKLNQQFFRNSPSNPSGKITITGGINAGLYSDLSSATLYLQANIIGTLSNVTLNADVLKFDVPAGSEISGTAFLSGISNISFEDQFGLITKIADYFCDTSTGLNVVLKNVEFKNSCFDNASGNVTINNILFSQVFNQFATNFTGIMNITGNIGPSEGPDYGLFFPNPGGTLNVLASKLTSNAGGKEGDLFNAEINGNIVNYTL